MAVKKELPVRTEPREGLFRAANQAAVRTAERAPEADHHRRHPEQHARQLIRRGHAAMAVESGRAFLLQEVRSITAKAMAGEAFIPNDAARMEMAGLVARENARKAVDRLFSVRGAHGLFESGYFECYYRDVRMGTLHAVSAPDLVREQVGKHLFDIPLDVEPRWAWSSR